MTDQMSLWGGSTARSIAVTQPSTRRMSRRTDPPTSNGAAVYSLPNHAEGRRRALSALVAAGTNGLTDHELEDATAAQGHRIKQTSIGKRRLDLMELGLVEPVVVDGKQLRRLTSTGATAGVYRVTPNGIAAHQADQITGAQS